MTAKIFHDSLQDLVHRAMSDSPCPLSQMILDLEIEKQKCVNAFLQIEAQKMALEIAKKIIPANGHLPEIKFDR